MYEILVPEVYGVPFFYLITILEKNEIIILKKYTRKYDLMVKNIAERHINN